MNELIKISSNENDEQVVSARELHKGLGLKKRFSIWWEQNSKLLIENEDFTSVLSGTVVNNGAKRELQDYALTIDTAKHLAMQSQTEKGREYRTYFIQVEKAWNSPDMVMKRALQIADKRVIALQNENSQLQLETSVQKQQIAELQPKASYYDWVLQTKGLLAISVIAKQYGKSAQWLNKLLHELGIQYKQGKVWLLYQKYAEQGYTKTNFAPDDAERLHPHTYWTQKGMLFIYETLKKENILPLVEHEEVA
ncbi:phage antirepressor KilAC domain-containing protein [Lactococcus lactis]|uniref:phage antirepressor KilAC domain-containing protein n=1 Tax=Lactococcus lactis TaxID=1358 RepID=UPI0003482570|nr:phage antirepressor KilAC domain-containing protein [Lactococcus lactis]ATY87931.1 phage antirepressor Ant [Lactococcus lactis subsp. lactis]ATZ01486.1 phage antirepressor Ant [Lactococcus lactis subsp. lactis]QOK49302.1 phage antirepressor KilAC domain-containing protein [Lactococcus lactis]